MKTQRVYLDTSVIGGCFDAEFAPWSNALMKDFRIGIYHPVVSDIVAAEVQDAPERNSATSLCRSTRRARWHNMEPTQVDAVAMTRRIRDAHAEQLKNATAEERIAFIREKARRFHEELKERNPDLQLNLVEPGSRS